MGVRYDDPERRGFCEHCNMVVVYPGDRDCPEEWECPCGWEGEDCPHYEELWKGECDRCGYETDDRNDLAYVDGEGWICPDCRRKR